MALTDKQQVFVEEYLATWNASEAARRAGYSDGSARVAGHRLLTNDNVAEEIKNRIAEKVMTADEVLVRITEQGRAAYSEYFMPNGTVNLAQLIADGKAHLIKSIKKTKYGTNVEFYDAHAARELLGKHHKLFADKLDVNVIGTPDFTADERAEAQKELDAWRNQKKNAETSNG